MPLDQADALVQIDTLTKNLAAANASIVTLTTERDAARASLATASASVTTLTASIVTVTGERDAARASLVTITTERDALKGTQADFDKKMACELAKHGIRERAIATHAGGGSGAGSDDDKTGMTLTQIAAAVVAGTMGKDEALALSKEVNKANAVGKLTRLNHTVA